MTLVEDGRYICGLLLVGGSVYVMGCCGRRIHTNCLKFWLNFDFKPLSRKTRTGELIKDKARMLRICSTLPHLSGAMHQYDHHWTNMNAEEAMADYDVDIGGYFRGSA